ncbi:MAG: tRNA (N(6)-L-threonylcarbamoyladenosine(37)-C(2))-methylthiotransferase MtaB [Prevotella sp.]|nr:tRNA (N(6)-L-threonylcarbamoyladenosine(37)-C(2))-methylthiotransferase MtaB [Prevotella sp.]
MIDTSAFQGKRAAYYTLGCKLNFSETSTFAKMLEDMGVVNVNGNGNKGEKADICLINTCSVTEVADSKCRQQIRKMVKQHPNAFVVVTGCYAQLSPDAIAHIDGVDLVLGSNEKATLIQHLSEKFTENKDKDKDKDIRVARHVKEITSFAPSCSRGDRTRYWLKVQDGCNYFCTYCTIPFARGNSRNPSIASLVEQARQAAAEGGKEIVLTGVNIGDFGQTTGESCVDLVKAHDTVEGIQRYRISSLEPDLITDDLIDFCARSRAFMPHFHIPLQSGSDTVLRLMHRHYDTALFTDRIMRIKEAMPDAFLGIDVMVGCRGETPECFDETYRLLESLPVAQLHVFPNSERPGTAALKIPYTVDDREKRRRSQMLLELSRQKTEAFYNKYIGTRAKVLFEKASRGKQMQGFTENYIKASLHLPPAGGVPDHLDNQIVEVTLMPPTVRSKNDVAPLRAELLSS